MRLAKGVTGGGFASLEEPESKAEEEVAVPSAREEGSIDSTTVETDAELSRATASVAEPKLLDTDEGTLKDPVTGRVKSKKQQEIEDIRLSTSPSVLLPLPNFISTYAGQLRT